MKNWKLYFSLVALLSFAVAGFSQSSAKADQIVKASQEKFKSLSDLKASFTYTLSNPNMKKPIVKNGNVVLSGNKYAITFPEEEMYCNGKAVWVVLAMDEEVTITDFDPESSLSVEKIYSIYEEGMKSRYDGEEDGLEKVTLFSNDKNSDIIKTEVWVRKSDKLIGKAKMYARNGSQYAYDMKNITPNAGVSGSVFTFDHGAKEEEGWIVTDLRN